MSVSGYGRSCFLYFVGEDVNGKKLVGGEVIVWSFCGGYFFLVEEEEIDG